MKSRGNPAPARVPPKEFIRVWQQAESVAEVAQKLRCKKGTCRVRAFRYRKMGVPLKVFPPVEVELPDWDELAEYAEECLPPVERTTGPVAGGDITGESAVGSAH